MEHSDNEKWVFLAINLISYKFKDLNIRFVYVKVTYTCTQFLCKI